MKLIIKIQGQPTPQACPQDLALFVRSIAEDIEKSIQTDLEVCCSHVGEVEGSGWMKYLNGSWEYTPE